MEGTLHPYPIPQENKSNNFPFQSNQLSLAVYNVPWHKLYIRQQKEFRYFLQMSQSTMKLKLMGSLTLNVETGIAVRFYSVYWSINQELLLVLDS